MQKVDLSKKVLAGFKALPDPIKKYPIFLGVSGGLDSCVLASVALSMRDRLPPLHLTHLNYHLRPVSDREESTLRQWARRENIPFHALRLYPKTKPANLQAWARERRFRYFSKLIGQQAKGKGVVWLAHHQRDQAETILHRMIRGAGLRGLAGMSVWEEIKTYPTVLRLFRPLLAVPHGALVKYAQFHQLPFHQDKTNLAPIYLRNRLRLQLLPWLLKENPRVFETLCELGQRSRDAEQAVDYFAEQWVRKQNPSRNGISRISTQGLKKLPRAMIAAIGEKLLSRTEPEIQSLSKILPQIQAYLRNPTRSIEIPLKGAWRLSLDPQNISLRRGAKTVGFPRPKRSKGKPARFQQSRERSRNP